MSYPGERLVIERKLPMDTEIWGDFSKLQKEEVPLYEALNLPHSQAEEAKRIFFDSNCESNPDLTVTYLETSQLAEQEKRWLDLKDQLLKDRQIDGLLRHAHLWRINEAIAGCRILEASATGDMRRFKAYNRFIYGEPSQEVFAATIEWFRGWAAEHLNSSNEPIKQSALKVLELLPSYGGDASILLPTEEVFRLIRDQQFADDGYFTLALAGVELSPTETVTPGPGDLALRTALNNIGASHVGIEDARGKGWSVTSQSLNRPADYSMPYLRFVGLPIGHELKHILEGINGGRQKVRLFSTGLDRYEKGNEGRAVIGEQVVYETPAEFTRQQRWHDLLCRNLAIGIGLGTLGEPKDFVQTYKIVNALHNLWERVKLPSNTKQADLKAHDKSWQLLATKVFKGTDGQGGAVYQKDNYLEYNVRVWEVAAHYPELIKLGDLGKFDVTNNRHIQLALAFGVLPQQAGENYGF